MSGAAEMSGLSGLGRMFDLSGQVAVVTGASRGIGAAMAHALAAAGADIIGVSSSSASLAPGSETEARITGLGRTFTPLACDFTDPDAVKALPDRITRAAHEAPRGVAPTILVNNAGTIRRTPAAEHSLADWEEVIQVNLTAQFVLTQALARPMLQAGRGKIIFTASLLSYQGGITVPGYTASKAAIAGLVKALANEWAPRGVNVNAIAPGYIATDNTAALRADPVRHDAILDRIPAARWGRPEDLAGATVFLASPASDYVHGTTLPVDGGWLGR